MRNMVFNEINLVNNVDRPLLCDNIYIRTVKKFKKGCNNMLTEGKYFGSKLYKTALKTFFSCFLAVCNVN